MKPYNHNNLNGSQMLEWSDGSLNLPTGLSNRDYVYFDGSSFSLNPNQGLTEFQSAKGGNGKGGGRNGGDDTGDDTGGDTSSPSLYYTYTSGSDAIDDSLEFNITINFYGTETEWTPNLLEDFVQAADYLSTVITGDIADVTYQGEAIDDIVIDASLLNIDGSGGVLGRAGPTVVRTANALPAKAIMEFDVADAQDFDDLGLWDDIVLHEMIHSLGFGTMWDTMGLVTTYVDDNGTRRPHDDTFDYRFTGTNANDAFQQDFYDLFVASGGLGIFVESEGGSGTAGGHWDEAAFDTELMTGYIDASGNYISPMTVASLEDMGYQVTWANWIL